MNNTTLTFCQGPNKQPPFFSKFYPINKQERKHLNSLSGYLYNFSLNNFHQYNVDQKKTKIIYV